MKKTMVIFKRFERFWHWGQAVLVLLLIATGLDIHGVVHLFGFATSSSLHHWAGFIWAAMVILIFTWILTTGEWKQFVPNTQGIDGVIRFYLYGVFVGEAHPHHMTAENKFNPLQRMGYLGLLFVLIPIQIVTGVVFYFFPELRAAGYIDQIGTVAIIHTVTAYIIVAFLIVHLYLITLGAKLSTHIKAMLTGKETVDE